MRNPSLRWPLMAAAVAGSVCTLASNNAFASAWLNASGSNSGFGWASGQNNTDKFGNPTVHSWGFAFNNTVNFRATGGGGTGASATDFARVTVDRALSSPAGAPAIHFITVQEFGTWSNAISQASDFTVQADYSIFRFSPSPPGATGSLPMTVTFFPNGQWTAERTLVAGGASPPFSNLDWNRFQITVTNTIQVAGTAPDGSFIEKLGMRIVVPEPTTLLSLVAGLGSLALRRSRR